MLEIREEEMNMVNGGSILEGLIGAPKYNYGEWVVSKSLPAMGVGTIVGRMYLLGWNYTVQAGDNTYTASEDDLEYAIRK